MGVAEWIATVVGTGGFLAGLAALLSYFRPKVVEARRLDMEEDRNEIDLAAANLNVAKGTVEFVKETYEAQVARVLADQAEMRKDFDQYRRDTGKRLSELATQLRSKKAEVERLEHENQHLRDQVAEKNQLARRVDELEAEVARLKANRGEG